MAKSNAKGLATVLSFEKKIVLSDALMYGTTWDDRQGRATALSLREKSVRGTISNRLKAAVANDPAKLNAEVEKPNLQTVDAASLLMDQDTLKVTFTMKILPGAAIPAACNVADHKASILNMGQRYAEQYGFEVIQYESSSDMYQAVIAGEAVACFEDYPVIGYEISRGLGLTLPTPMEKGSSYGFATLKGANPELVEMFNKGLENIKASGRYDEILNTYIAK